MQLRASLSLEGSDGVSRRPSAVPTPAGARELCRRRCGVQDLGALIGGDPLNNVLLATWGWLRGGFGVKPTVRHGADAATTKKTAPQLKGTTTVRGRRLRTHSLCFSVCRLFLTGSSAILEVLEYHGNLSKKHQLPVAS